ncbi:MAG: OmpH family outer membrane protein [Bacteroidaceae bacterium]|nr:OmpH family outer membrane protein [Bacteroidaceae bacterium]MBR5159148.1 OmpH family outer membrane protein [Bacteroidaceae bacterium]
MNFKSVSTFVLSSVLILGFTQCSQQAAAPQQQAPIAVSGLKIAYIDVDSLLANYTFYQDLAEEMTRKEENYRLALTEEANKWQKDVEDHQKKIANGVYSSIERAQSEENRLTKRQQALQEKSDKYTQELLAERDANSQKISETVDNFVKEYNKSHGFNIIISKASLLYADEGLNITAEILDGLNAAYNQPDK